MFIQLKYYLKKITYYFETTYKKLLYTCNRIVRNFLYNITTRNVKYIYFTISCQI